MIIPANIDGTEISGKPRVSLDAPMSPSLGEQLKREAFTDISSPTRIEKADYSEIFNNALSSTPVESGSYDVEFIDAHLGDQRPTPLSTDRVMRRARAPMYWDEPQSDPLAKAMTDRVRLLAKKYVAKERLSEEQAARLAIVTERVRQLLPAVTVGEYEALEKTLTVLKDISESNQSLREKLLQLRKNA